MLGKTYILEQTTNTIRKKKTTTKKNLTEIKLTKQFCTKIIVTLCTKFTYRYKTEYIIIIGNIYLSGTGGYQSHQQKKKNSIKNNKQSICLTCTHRATLHIFAYFGKLYMFVTASPYNMCTEFDRRTTTKLSNFS